MHPNYSKEMFYELAAAAIQKQNAELNNPPLRTHEMKQVTPAVIKLLNRNEFANHKRSLPYFYQAMLPTDLMFQKGSSA